MNTTLKDIPLFTENELHRMAVEEQFILFCDEDEIFDIMGYTEGEVRGRIGKDLAKE